MYTNHFVIQKPNGAKRLLSYFNETINVRTTPVTQTLQDPWEILNIVCVYKYIYTIDLTDGYYRVRIGENMKRMMGIRIGNQYYRWEVLRMEIKQAPAFYNEFIEGISPTNNVQQYFDDIYIYHYTVEQLNEIVQPVCKVLAHHKIIINETKTQNITLTPKPILGVYVHSNMQWSRKNKICINDARIYLGNVLELLHVLITTTW